MWSIFAKVTRSFRAGFMRLFEENDSDRCRLAEIGPCFNDGFRGRLGWDPSIRHGPWLMIVLNINLFVTASVNNCHYIPSLNGRPLLFWL